MLFVFLTKLETHRSPPTKNQTKKEGGKEERNHCKKKWRKDKKKKNRKEKEKKVKNAHQRNAEGSDSLTSAHSFFGECAQKLKKFQSKTNFLFFFFSLFLFFFPISLSWGHLMDFFREVGDGRFLEKSWRRNSFFSQSVGVSSSFFQSFCPTRHSKICSSD